MEKKTKGFKPVELTLSVHHPRHRQGVIQLSLDLDAKDFLQDRDVKAADVMPNQCRRTTQEGPHFLVVVGRVVVLAVRSPRQNVDLGRHLQKPICLAVEDNQGQKPSLRIVVSVS